MTEQVKKMETSSATQENEREVVLAAARNKKAEPETAVEKERAATEEGHSALSADFEKLVLENNTLLKELKDLEDALDSARKESSFHKANADAAQAEMRKIRKKEKKLKRSRYYRLGKIMVESVTKPGKGTVLMPYYVLRLALVRKTSRKKRAGK